MKMKTTESIVLKHNMKNLMINLLRMVKKIVKKKIKQIKLGVMKKVRSNKKVPNNKFSVKATKNLKITNSC